ncbi:MAG: hypothetical protein M1840_003799 [Geoglossum simile]|nr:MAG: hypothetical protein M1840_003799 [Geoglossum simile]
MSLFRRERESASTVKKVFAARINEFLNRVDGPGGGFFSRRGSSLDDVFTWGQKLLDEKKILEQQLTQCVDQWQDGEKKIHKLTKARDLAESQLENTSLNLQTALTDINKEKMDRERERLETKQYYESSMNRLTMGHSTDMQKAVSRHREDMANVALHHKEEIGRLNAYIDKLVGQLLINQNDSEAWPDEKLKVKFRELQRLVESVTSPSLTEFRIPPNQQLGLHLDPANFVGRAGRGKSHFLLKNKIWAIFREQFFTVPFGFGAFGPGKAQGELMNIYFAWWKTLDGSAGTASRDGENLTIFRRDRLANKWRSATFQSIGAALVANGGRDLAPVAKLSADNVNQTATRIISVLSEVSKLSDGRVSGDIEDEVREMANLCFSIALQFGIHTAQLRLSVPDRGEQITIGDEFRDCQDGERYKGTVYAVDLVVVPGLQKIGDGGSDMTTKHIVVPCGIYPELPNS